MPSSGRKVSRASVTKGARETEKQQKATFFGAFKPIPQALRASSFPQGSHGSVRFSALCRKESRRKSKSFKPENSRKTQVAQAPSVASGDSSLSEGAYVCARFFSVPQKNFLPVFRFFQANPSPV